MEKKLEVKNLKISFRTDAGKVQAVRNIDFDLYKGETLAIVGESGSGKSVTNKAIIGISAVNAIIESGEIIYDGMDLLQIDEEDFHKLRGDKIAMIFQDPLSALDPICRIGTQLTEAMILKNRANRRESRIVFNRTMKDLLVAMNASMNVDANSAQGKKNKQNTIDFNEFEKKHLALESEYNTANQNASTAIEEIDDLVFHIEKNAVSDFKREWKNIVKLATKSQHEYVCGPQIAVLAEELANIAKECGKDYARCIDSLNAVKDMLQEGVNKLAPNFFALGYYLMFANEPLPAMETEELNVFLREYLDNHFMLAFIDDAKNAIEYSFNQSLAQKKVVIDAIDANRHVYADGEPDKKLYLATAKVLIAEVQKSLDKLALIKDSVAYTFKTSFIRAINNYFDAIPNNKREQKRFDKEQAKIDKIVAKGKTPDYKVTPAKIVDLDVAHENILLILDRLVEHYKKAIENAGEFNADERAVALIDFFKEKAGNIAYHVGRMVAKQRALHLMEEVGIPEPKKRYRQYPFQFSGGMRQRIVIAIALAANPDILICDEPTTALDVTIQAQILELINKIKKERNLSIIFITHDLGVVANMADRIAVMYAGKIVEMGTAEDVFYSPAHPYTWALLSSMPDLDTNEKLEAIPGTPPNMIYPPKGDAFAARNKYAMKIDFEMQPPMFKISDTHSAATWLLHPQAPKVEMPKIVSDRIARMKALANSTTEGGEN